MARPAIAGAGRVGRGFAMSDSVRSPRPECEKVLLVQAELDGELDAAEAAALEMHRIGCPICQAAQQELLQARALIRHEPYEATPDDVRARVMARLRQVEPPAAPVPTIRPRQSWAWLRGPSFGFGLG